METIKNELFTELEMGKIKGGECFSLVVDGQWIGFYEANSESHMREYAEYYYGNSG